MIYRAMGSLGFVAAARSVWAVGPDKEEPRRMIFTPLKSNLAGQTDALAYTVIPSPENCDVPVIDWEEDPVPAVTLQAPSREHGAAESTRQAAEWLTEALADGAVPTKEIERLAQNARIGRNALLRARQVVGVTSSPSGQSGAWMLALPAAYPALFDEDDVDVVPF